MTNGFRINKQGIRKMTKEIERELARNPVRVPLKVDRPGGAGSHSTTVNNYNAPIVTVVVTGTTAEMAEVTRQLIEGLSSALPL